MQFQILTLDNFMCIPYSPIYLQSLGRRWVTLHAGCGESRRVSETPPAKQMRIPTTMMSASLGL